MPQQPLNIVILGGSFAGLSVAHRFLDHIIHQLRTFDGAPTYRILLISPSTRLYWNICAPQALVSSGRIRTEDAFIPIEPAFFRHPCNKFTFIQGRATAVDTSAKKVTIELVKNDSTWQQSGLSKISTKSAVPTASRIPITCETDCRSNVADQNSKIQTMPYHALIIATGSFAHSPLYSLHSTHEQTLGDLQDTHCQLETARSIMIVGGGPSGVETAGQLSTYYNQHRRWRKWKAKHLHPTPVTDSLSVTRTHRVIFPTSSNGKKSKRDSSVSRQSRSLESPPPTIQVTPPIAEARAPKTITLVSGGDRLLPKLHPKIGKKAEQKLKKLGVHIVHNIRQLGATTNEDGTMNCILNNGMTITSDLLISATGVEPNTRFLPSSMLDELGYVITDRETLRVHGRGVGERVYAIGDCAAYSKNYTLDVYDAVPVVLKNLHNDLLAYEYRLQTVMAPAGKEGVGVKTDACESGPTTTQHHHDFVAETRPHSPTLPGLRISSDDGLPPSIPVQATPSPLSISSQFKCSPALKATPSSKSPIYYEPLLTPAQAREKIAALQDAFYIQRPTDSQLMPISRFGGVGIIRNWRIPSLMVWLVKGRDYALGRAQGVVGRGKNPYGIT